MLIQDLDVGRAATEKVHPRTGQCQAKTRYLLRGHRLIFLAESTSSQDTKLSQTPVSVNTWVR